MMLIVLLYFLGCFVTAATGSTIRADCMIGGDEGCGAMDHACKAKFHLSSEFFEHEIVVMTYQQDENASEPSCSDSGCEDYTSGKAYYVVDNFSASTEDRVVTSEQGWNAFCEETCSVDDGDPSGYCQLAGQCTNSTRGCSGTVAKGTATFERFSKDILVDCDLDDEENCGTADMPCNAKFHASSGFSQDDLVSMLYKQNETNHDSCTPWCQWYTSNLTYYTVVDTTTAAEGQVIMGPKGLAPACPGACAENATDPFSGFCQEVDNCVELAGQCAGSTNPVGKAYFQWESPVTTTSTTTPTTGAGTTTPPTGTTTPPTGTTTPPTGTTTPPTGTGTATTEPTTASAMTAAFGLAPAAFAVVAVLALWA